MVPEAGLREFDPVLKLFCSFLWFYLYLCIKMVNGWKVEDRLDGYTNFASWKPRVLVALEENDLLEYVNSDVAEPSDDAGKIQWKKNKILAETITIDLVKDHLIPVISKLESAKVMFKTHGFIWV